MRVEVVIGGAVAISKGYLVEKKQNLVHRSATAIGCVAAITKVAMSNGHSTNSKILALPAA